LRFFTTPRLVRGLVLFGGLAIIVLAAYAGAWCVDSISGGDAPQTATWIGATLIVAVAVPLVRPQLDRLADRVVEKLGGDRYGVVTDFVERIADTLAVDDVLPEVAKTAAHALRSSRGEVRLWLADGSEWRQTWPPGEASRVADAISVSLRHGGRTVGSLAVDTDESQVSGVERDLLKRLAGPAGLALSNVRLTFELRHRLSEAVEIAEQVRRSRERLLDAATVQRHRFAREVEARVIRPLDAAGAALEAVAIGAGELGSVRASTEDALIALRELAAGVFPAALVQKGIAAALELHLDANFPMAHLHADAVAANRHPPSVEAAVYFCAVALMTDAARDEPVRVALTVSPTADQLELRVRTEEAPSPETVALVRDRAEAAGATARLDEQPMIVAVPISVLAGAR
jgi:hypothetical protein